MTRWNPSSSQGKSWTSSTVQKFNFQIIYRVSDTELLIGLNWTIFTFNTLTKWANLEWHFIEIRQNTLSVAVKTTMWSDWFVGNQDLKKNEPKILCARSTSRSSEQSTKCRSHSERCERFVYSVVKITWLYDYQKWRTHFSRNSRGAQRFMVFFSWLCFRDADWLGGQTAITWHKFQGQSVPAIIASSQTTMCS